VDGWKGENLSGGGGRLQVWVLWAPSPKERGKRGQAGPFGNQCPLERKPRADNGVAEEPIVPHTGITGRTSLEGLNQTKEKSAIEPCGRALNLYSLETKKGVRTPGTSPAVLARARGKILAEHRHSVQLKSVEERHSLAIRLRQLPSFKSCWKEGNKIAGLPYVLN